MPFAEPRLLLVNSIGLTGAEVLTAALSAHPAVRMLPGQNFIGLDHCLYRQGDFSRVAAEKIFDALAAEYYMTSGRVWSGLTKDMSAEERGCYDRIAHRARFLACATVSPSLLDHARVFMQTYFEGTAPAYYGFFGQNLVLSHSAELARRQDWRMLACVNRVEHWLANISQRMTWDCRQAAKFWVVNHLLLEAFSREQPAYLEISLETLVDRPEASMATVWKHLGLQPAAGERPAGFIRFEPKVFDKIRRDADLIVLIYGDCLEVQLAHSLRDWAPAFLHEKDNRSLMERYREYWNSTSHTNFDWIGPIEEEIIGRAALLAGCRGGRNLSMDFYHRYYQLSSLTHDAPRVLEPQILGMLEAEIVVPPLPYFLKVCMEHLTNLARIAERQAHSYRSLRAGALYAKLKVLQPQIERLGLAPRLAAMEAQINSAEAKISHALDRHKTQ